MKKSADDAADDASRKVKKAWKDTKREMNKDTRKIGEEAKDFADKMDETLDKGAEKTKEAWDKTKKNVKKDTQKIKKEMETL